MRYTCCEEIMWHLMAPGSLRFLLEQGRDASSLKRKAKAVYHQMVARTPGIGGPGGNSLHVCLVAGMVWLPIYEAVEGGMDEACFGAMVGIEVEATQNFMEVLRRQGRDIPELDDQLCHIIASGMFHGIFEVVVHDMPYGRAKHYVQQLQDFYLAGWHRMMGV